MAYGACRFLSLIPNLTNNSTSITCLPRDVTPGSAQLIEFVSSGCSIIHTKLTSMGYSVPVASTAGVYDFLGQLENWFTAWQAESARSSARVSTRERSRSDMFKKMFYDGLDSLEEMDLTLAGVNQDTADPGWYVGGISQSDKDSVAGDTDRVKSRFARGKFRNVSAPDAQRSAS